MVHLRVDLSAGHSEKRLALRSGTLKADPWAQSWEHHSALHWDHYSEPQMAPQTVRRWDSVKADLTVDPTVAMLARRSATRTAEHWALSKVGHWEIQTESC